jgi:release factor glutamine methyltransferase
MTTTGELVTAGTERLRAAGDPSPRLDAELLLALAIGVERTAIVAHAAAPVGPGAESAYLGFLARREDGEPIAYIRGFKEFHGIAIGTDPRALIPRPETEGLVDAAVREVMHRLTATPPGAGGSGRLAGHAARVRVIDVGTGSGAIAIALAVELRRRGVPGDEVALVALDSSSEALDLARENAVGQAVADRITFIGGDLLPPSPTTEPWHVVIANLPYVRTALLEPAPAPTSHEPLVALDGGADGLAVIDRLLERLPSGLEFDGVALLEIGSDQGVAIVELVERRLPGWSCHVESDLAGLPRIARIGRAAA